MSSEGLHNRALINPISTTKKAAGVGGWGGHRTSLLPCLLVAQALEGHNYSVLMTRLRDKNYRPHFIIWDPGAQRGRATWTESHSTPERLAQTGAQLA